MKGVSPIEIDEEEGNEEEEVTRMRERGVEGEEREISGVKEGNHRSNLIIISPDLGASGQALVMIQELEDVEVTEPEWATFQCEVSVAISRPPVWTLNGEGLQPGPRVRLESSGTVHRLTLKETSRDMSGVVKFTMGKAKSSATLSVKSTN